MCSDWFLGGGCSWRGGGEGVQKQSLLVSTRFWLSMQSGSWRLKFNIWWWRVASNKSIPVFWGECCFLGKVLGCSEHLTARIWSQQQLLTLCKESLSCSSWSEQNYQGLGEPHMVISWLDLNYCQKPDFKWTVAFLFNDPWKKEKEEEVNRGGRSCFPSPFQLPPEAGIVV